MGSTAKTFVLQRKDGRDALRKNNLKIYEEKDFISTTAHSSFVLLFLWLHKSGVMLLKVIIKIAERENLVLYH